MGVHKALVDMVVSRALRAAGVPEVHISFIGDRALQRKLNRLETRTAKKVVSAAFRKSAKRIRRRVVQNLSGNPVQVRRGELRRLFERAKIRGSSRRGRIRIGIVEPDRDELGITSGDPNYWPYAVEYGHGGVPPHPYLRPAVDDHYDQEVAEIGRDIGAGIEREAKR